MEMIPVYILIGTILIMAIALIYGGIQLTKFEYPFAAFMFFLMGGMCFLLFTYIVAYTLTR